MPTARSSTERGLACWVDAVADLRHLLRFRAATVRRPRAAGWGVLLVLFVSVSMASFPARLTIEPGGLLADLVVPLRENLPAMLAGMLGLAAISAVAGGGGRELMPHDQAAIHPISPITEHLGALALAPLNLAWLVQSWLIMAVASFVAGPERWVAAQVVVVLYLLLATAIAQVVAWTVEAVRRRPRRISVTRAASAAVLLACAALQATGRLLPVLDASPTRYVAQAIREGVGEWWWVTVVGEAVLILAAVAVGVRPAASALRRTPREELHIESGSHPARSAPRSDLAMLRRLDRASVWRSVPMRRGLIVLSIGPSLVALVGGLPWASIAVLPALVASGGVLLFGVNSWCLDGRGLLWRESLPVEPSAVFTARAVTLAEWVGLSAALTVLVASLRAGVPSPAEALAVTCVWVVVTTQVVAVAMSWSGRRPFAADMRAARSTPAPPIVMLGYSARLAASTTLTALLLAYPAQVPGLTWMTPAMAVPFVAWSWVRLRRARRRWVDAPQRACVVVAVAA